MNGYFFNKYKVIMKHLILFIFITNSLFSSEIESKFNFQEKAHFVDYVGCVIANNNIICYGTNSSFVISSDEGKNWQQGRIGNVGIIVKLEYIDNIIIGFSLDGHSIKSRDLGKTWQTSKLNYIDSIYYIHYESGYFFARCYNSLKVIDKNFNLISEYSDSMLTWSYKIYDVKNTQRNNFVIVGENIYFDNLSNKLYSINKYDLIIGKPKLDSIIVCDTCKNNVKNIVVIGSKLYFLIDKNYPTDYSGTHQFEYTLTNNKTNEIVKPKFKINFSKYFNIENNFYQVYVNGSAFSYNYSRLELKKYDKQNDSLKSINDSINIPNDFFNVTDLKKLNDSLLVIVSIKNTILISRNLGKDWETISTLNTPNYFNCLYEHDSLKLFVNNFDIYSSYDNNITYKINLLDLKNTNYKKLGSLKRRYIDSTGKIIMIYSVMSDPDNNVIISNDFGKTYEFKNQTLLNYNSGDYNFFDKVDDKFINIINYNPMYKEFNKNYFHYSKYTENMDYITRQTDSNNYVHSAVFKDENNGFLISTLNDSLGGRIEIIQRNSAQRKWDRKTIQKVNIPLTINGTFNLKVNEIGNSKDSVIIVYQYNLFTSDTTFTSIFSYDNKSEKFELVYQNAGLNSKPNVFLDFKNKFIIAGLNFYMESNNRNNLLDWKIYTVKDSSNWSWCKASADEKYYLVNYSSPTFIASTYKLTLSSSSKIESQTEDQTYFYSYPPFPTPSMNQVKSLIYWDMSYNIDDSDIGVYDIYGNKISDRDKISINKLNAYSGYLTWDCSGIATGVYMIQIKHGTNTHNIRAMVVR
jgi:hypothetical protein